MIDAGVQNELRKFQEHWAPNLAVSPLLELDRSWFSVAVIDAITFPLRQRDDLSGFEKSILRGSAAYLAVMAADCWKAFGAEASVEYGSTGVVIRAVSGPELGRDEEFVVHVERDLARLILELPRPMQIFSRFERMISNVENFVSPFAFSLFCGLIPTGEGPWENKSPENFAPQIEQVVRYLAAGCAAAYGRIYPDESLGQVAELYLCGLIYPLTLMAEPLPVLASVNGLIEFAREYRVQLPQLEKLAENLARLPDERIAQTGFVIQAALCDPELTPEIRALSYSWGWTAGLLRPAMVEALRQLRGIEDWIDKPEFSDQHLAQVRKEIGLGFIPWLKIPLERVLACGPDTELRQLIRALAEFNMTQSLLVNNQLCELTPDDLDLRLQRVYLDLLNGDAESAEKKLKNILSEPGSEKKGQLFNLLGMIQLTEQNFEQAEISLRRAQGVSVSIPLLHAEASNNLGWFYLLGGNSEQALEALSESLRSVPDSIAALLNKTTILHGQLREEEARSVDRRLLKLAPLERAVFRGLIYDPAVPGE